MREPPGWPSIAPEDIAIGVAHRDQAELIRGMLRRSDIAGAERIVVDNANRLRGREFEITVVWHPLSGRRDATEFHLEAPFSWREVLRARRLTRLPRCFSVASNKVPSAPVAQVVRFDAALRQANADSLIREHVDRYADHGSSLEVVK